MNFSRSLITLLTLLFMAHGETLFEKGNSFYQEGQYDSAEHYYIAAIEEGGVNSSLLYNLSNAVYRQHRLGEAILFLERAKLLAPHDEDIQQNLAYLATQTVDAIPEPVEGPVLAWIRTIHNLITLKAKGVILLALSVLAVLLLSSALFRDHARTRTIYALIATLIFAGLFALSAGVQIYTVETRSSGIILSESVNAMNEPKGSTLIFSTHEGTKCLIVKKRDGWIFIKLSNGVAGWVPQDALGEI